MEKKDSFYLILLGMGFILVIFGLSVDYLNVIERMIEMSYITLLMEGSGMVLVCIAMFYHRPSNLTQKLFICLILGSISILVIIIDIIYLQSLFTQDFIIKSIIFCFALLIIGITLGVLWPKKQDDIIELVGFEIIE